MYPKNSKFDFENRVSVSNKRARLQAILVSVYSVANCVGRFSTAFVPEKAFREFGIARTHFLSIISGLLAGAMTLNAYYTLNLLPLCSFVTGKPLVSEHTTQACSLKNSSNVWFFATHSLHSGNGAPEHWFPPVLPFCKLIIFFFDFLIQTMFL